MSHALPLQNQIENSRFTFHVRVSLSLSHYTNQMRQNESTLERKNRFASPKEFAFYLHIVHNGFEGFIAHKIEISNRPFVFIRIFSAHSSNDTHIHKKCGHLVAKLLLPPAYKKLK